MQCREPNIFSNIFQDVGVKMLLEIMSSDVHRFSTKRGGGGIWISTFHYSGHLRPSRRPSFFLFINLSSPSDASFSFEENSLSTISWVQLSLSKQWKNKLGRETTCIQINNHPLKYFTQCCKFAVTRRKLIFVDVEKSEPLLKSRQLKPLRWKNWSF